MKRLRNVSLSERFWQKVKASDGCWEWLGSKNPKGYGTIQRNGLGTNVASRVSWELHFGDIPDGLFVCHHCDNPGCTNPEHLFLGTNKDNQQDSKRKGRRSDQRGEKNGNSKLTYDQAKTIRHLYEAERRTNKELSEFFNTSTANVWMITTRRTWIRQ